MAHRVLLVEDELDVREIVAQAIRDAGYSAIGVSNGRSAVEYLRSNEAPRLILLDWHLPGLGGDEVMNEVLSTARLAAVPVVLMTGDVAAKGSAEIKFAGLLPKPFTWDTLLAILHRFLPDHSEAPAHPEPVQAEL